MDIAGKRNLDPRRRRLSLLWGTLITVGVVMIIIGVLAMIKVVHYNVYQIPQYGVQIKYPTYFRVVPIDAPGGVIAFASPPRDTYDNFIENVNVTYYDLAKDPMSFARLSETIIRQVTGTFQGYIKVTESKRFVLHGRPAYRFGYAGQGKDLPDPLQYLHVWTVIGDKAFIITYVAKEREYKTYMDEVNAMIKSFDVMSVKPAADHRAP